VYIVRDNCWSCKLIGTLLPVKACVHVFRYVTQGWICQNLPGGHTLKNSHLRRPTCFARFARTGWATFFRPPAHNVYFVRGVAFLAKGGSTPPNPHKSSPDVAPLCCEPATHFTFPVTWLFAFAKILHKFHGAWALYQWILLKTVIKWWERNFQVQEPNYCRRW